MNWKKHRRLLVRVGASVALVGLVALIIVYVPRCRRSASRSTAKDAGTPATIVGMQRPDAPVPVSERPGPGTLSLSGGVFDAAGNPVSGVEISASFELGPGVDSMAPAPVPSAPVLSTDAKDGGAAPANVPDPASRVNNTDSPPDSLDSPDSPDSPDHPIPEYGLDTMPVVVTVSGDDGGFTLQGLIAGRYRLRVEGQDIFTSEVRFFDVPADGIRLIVARRAAVQGVVLGVAGQPAIGARVGLHSDTQGQIFALADDSGRFSFADLQEGVFQVWAGHGELAARALQVSRLGRGPFTDVTLTLEPGAIITGRVMDMATQRGLSALVRLTATDSPTGTLQPARHVQSGADGVFRVEGMPLGRYTAEALAPGYVAVEAIDFQAGGTFSPVIELAPGAVLAGRVVNGDGAGVADAVISARGVDQNGVWRLISEQTLSQELQRARGLVPELGAPASADSNFIAKGELGVMLGPIPYPPPQGAASLRIARALREPGEPGQPGQPRDTADTGELPVHPDAASRFVTDAQGYFRITGLSAGSYRLLAKHTAYADALGDHLTLGLGERRADLELIMHPGVMLVGHVTNSRDELVVGATILAEPLHRRSRAKNAGSKGARPNNKPVTSAAQSIAAGGLFNAQPADVDALIAESMLVQAVTSSDGSYTLGPIASDVQVRVSAVRHGDVERVIELTAGDAGQEFGRTVSERREDFVLPVADAVLTARVRDSVSFPVREARVTIERISAKRQPSKDSRARTVTASDKWPDTWRRLGATDDNGGFEIAGLAPGRYRVRIEHPGFPGFETEAETGPELNDITLPFGGGIDAEIRDAHTRSALVGARVLATGPGDARVETASAEDGGIELVPLVAGTWTLEVSAPGYVPAAVKVQVTAGTEPRAITTRDLRIEIERGATIAGTVRDHQGVRVRGAEVRAGERTTTTDEQGGFRMRDVLTGAVEIRAQRQGVSGSVHINLSPGDELVTLEIHLQAPPDESQDTEPEAE